MGYAMDVIFLWPNTTAFDWNIFCHHSHVVGCHGNQRFTPGILHFTMSACLPTCYNLNLHWFYFSYMCFNSVKWGLPECLPWLGDIPWQCCIYGHIFWFPDIFDPFHLNISKSKLKFRWPPVSSVIGYATCHISVQISYVASRKTLQYMYGKMYDNVNN